MTDDLYNRMDQFDLIMNVISRAHSDGRREAGQWTLGMLRDFLETVDEELIVYVNGVIAQSITINSYRGYYEDAALGVNEGGGIPVTAGDLLQIVKDAIGVTYVGYKGGEFLFEEDTLVWIAPWGMATGQLINKTPIVEAETIKIYSHVMERTF